MVIGVAGGVAGGKLVAPMFGVVDTIPEAFSLAALVCALFLQIFHRDLQLLAGFLQLILHPRHDRIFLIQL